jgi:ribokinase
LVQEFQSIIKVKMKSIVVAGSLNIDLVVSTARLPQPGETVAGRHFATFEGGKGFNQAVAARRAGGEVAFVGKLGADAFGDRLAAAMAAEGIDAAWVTRCQDPQISTGVASITVDALGYNTIVGVPGANFEITPADLGNAASVFQTAAVLLLQLEIPLEICQQAAQLAKQAGAKVILTPSPVPSQPLPSSLLASLDLLILNETEVILMAGLLPAAPVPKDEIDAAHYLLGKPDLNLPGPLAVVVTLGERGVVWVSATEVISVPSFQVEPVDSTAAGDSFTGALAFALSQDYSIREALRFANAAGALAVTRPGAYPSIPTAQDIKQFLTLNPPAVN